MGRRQVSKFKAGDRVRCTYSNPAWTCPVREGETYTVGGCTSEGYMWLVEADDIDCGEHYTRNDDAFELVTREAQPECDPPEPGNQQRREEEISAAYSALHPTPGPVYEGHALPQDDATRKGAPMFRGLLAYAPWACFAIAQLSMRGDVKHNGVRQLGVGPHWTMDKSSDHLDCVVRHTAEIRCLTNEQLRDPAHQVEADDEEYQRTALAWRAVMQLQEFGMRRYGFRRGAHARLSTDGGDK